MKIDVFKYVDNLTVFIGPSYMLIRNIESFYFNIEHNYGL